MERKLFLQYTWERGERTVPFVDLFFEGAMFRRANKRVGATKHQMAYTTLILSRLWLTYWLWLAYWSTFDRQIQRRPFPSMVITRGRPCLVRANRPKTFPNLDMSPRVTSTRPPRLPWYKLYPPFVPRSTDVLLPPFPFCQATARPSLKYVFVPFGYNFSFIGAFAVIRISIETPTLVVHSTTPV